MGMGGGRLSLRRAEQHRGANISQRKATQEGAACNPGDVTSAGDATSIPEQAARPLPSQAGTAARLRGYKSTWKSHKLSQSPSKSSARGRTDAQPAAQRCCRLLLLGVC